MQARYLCLVVDFSRTKKWRFRQWLICDFFFPSCLVSRAWILQAARFLPHEFTLGKGVSKWCCPSRRTFGPACIQKHQTHSTYLQTCHNSVSACDPLLLIGISPLNCWISFSRFPVFPFFSPQSFESAFSILLLIVRLLTVFLEVAVFAFLAFRFWKLQSPRLVLPLLSRSIWSNLPFHAISFCFGQLAEGHLEGGRKAICQHWGLLLLAESEIDSWLLR